MSLINYCQKSVMKLLLAPAPTHPRLALQTVFLFTVGRVASTNPRNCTHPLSGTPGELLVPSHSLSPGICSCCLLFSHFVVSESLRSHGLQHTRLPCPSLSPGVCSNSCPLSLWCHPTILSSVSPFFSCPQSFPAFVARGAFCLFFLFFFFLADKVLFTNLQELPRVNWVLNPQKRVESPFSEIQVLAGSHTHRGLYRKDLPRPCSVAWRWPSSPGAFTSSSLQAGLCPDSSFFSGHRSCWIRNTLIASLSLDELHESLSPNKVTFWGTRG